MLTDHVRDAAMSAVIFGFFASSWFGWAQESPPPAWRARLTVGSVASLLIAAAGGVLAWRRWSDGTVFDDATSRTFGIVVGIEFGAAALGAVVLALVRRAEWIPVWVAFVVGVHLFPVAAILEYPAVHVTAALITAVSIAAVPLARARSLRPSAVVGPPTGAILLVTAVLSLIAAL